MLLQDLPTPAILPPDSVKQVTREIITQLQTDPETFWHQLGQSALQFGLKVLAAIVIYIVGAWLIRWVKRLLTRVFERRKTERTLASFITSFISIMMTVMLIIVTVGTLGVDTTSLAALLAAGGMAIGMALSGTVQNFAGGIMLLAFKPFRAGNFINAQGYSGTVLEVSITTTKILTVDNRVVVLPNGALSNGTIDNYSARPFRRVEWQVSVAYGSDADACKQTLLAMMAGEQRILTAATDLAPIYDEAEKERFPLSTVNYRMDVVPDPFVGLLSLNANDITFVVRAWVQAADYWDVFFDMQQRFYTELPQHGFAFAYPHVDVTMVQ